MPPTQDQSSQHERNESFQLTPGFEVSFSPLLWNSLKLLLVFAGILGKLHLSSTPTALHSAPLVQASRSRAMPLAIRYLSWLLPLRAL